MAQAPHRTAFASSKKNALPKSGSNRSDQKREGPQVRPSFSRPLESGMPMPPGGASTTPSTTQPPQLQPQLQPQSKALATSTTSNTPTVSTTTAPTVTTTTSTVATTTTTSTIRIGTGRTSTTTTTLDADGIAQVVLEPDAFTSAGGMIAAMKANDQTGFEEVLNRAKLSAGKQAKKKGNPSLELPIRLRKINRICLVQDGLGTCSMTPLMVAAGRNKQPCLDLLLKAGADPNIGTADYGTPLLHAIYAQSGVEALDSLIKSGATVNQMASHQLLASRLEHIVIVRETGAALWTRKSEGQAVSALMAAACMGNVGHIQRLLAAGAELELKGGPRGYTALMFAVAAHKPDAVQALLAANADVNALAEDGANALYLASSQGNCEMMQMLIDAGAEVDRMDAEGMTTLMHVVYENGILVNDLMPDQLKEVVSLLRKNAAQPDQPMQARTDLEIRRDLHDPRYGEDGPRHFKRYIVQRVMESSFGRRLVEPSHY